MTSFDLFAKQLHAHSAKPSTSPNPGDLIPVNSVTSGVPDLPIGALVKFTDKCHPAWFFGPDKQIKSGIIETVETELEPRTLAYRPIYIIRYNDNTTRRIRVQREHIEPIT